MSSSLDGGADEGPSPLMYLTFRLTSLTANHRQLSASWCKSLGRAHLLRPRLMQRIPQLRRDISLLVILVASLAVDLVGVHSDRDSVDLALSSLLGAILVAGVGLQLRTLRRKQR